MNTEGNWNGPGSPEGERRDIENQARSAAEKARSQVRSLAETGREELADQIDGLGRALHRAGESLRDEQQGQAGYYSELLGDQAERVSRYLREHDSGALIGQVESLARRQPLLFLGGCVLAGFAIGRFLKASPPGGERMPLGVAGEDRYEQRTAVPVGITSPVVTSPTVPIPSERAYSPPLATPATGDDIDREEG